jgi:hypothetical protein
VISVTCLRWEQPKPSFKEDEKDQGAFRESDDDALCRLTTKPASANFMHVGLPTERIDVIFVVPAEEGSRCDDLSDLESPELGVSRRSS